MDEPTGQQKTCSKCRETKTLDQFGRDAKRRDGLNPWCRECKREAGRQRWQADPEAARAASREYQRRWRERNPDADRRRREANPEAFRASAAERMRRWREANPERRLETNRRWREKNPELYREQGRRRAAQYRTAVYDHYGRVCACPGCGATADLTIDHVNGDGKAHREQAGRGTRFYRWLIRNGFPDGFQTLCKPCNGSKATGPACRLPHTQALTA